TVGRAPPPPTAARCGETALSTAPAIRRPSTTRRWLRRLVILVTIGALAIGSFVGWQLYRRHVDDVRLRETIAELDAREPRWRLEDLEADRAVVPDVENSASVIRAARAHITPRLLTPGEEL